MTEPVLKRDILEEIESKHTTTDAGVDDAESKVKTDIASKHSTTQALIGSKHATTQAGVDDAESKVKTDIASKHGTTQALITSKHATTDANVDDAESKIKTDIASKHATTQSKIATVGAKVGTQLAYMKKYLVQGTTKLTGDPTTYAEEAASVSGTDAWTIMATKVIDGPESESKLIDSIFVDLGWKHKGEKESPAAYTKWVASHLDTGTAIAATAPDLTDSIQAPSASFTSVHRSGAIKLAGMNKLPLKLALVGKASATVGSKVQASILSDSVVELCYTI